MPYLLKIYLSNKNRLTHPFSHAKKSLIKNIQEIIGNKIYSVAPIKSDMIIESNNKKSAEEIKSHLRKRCSILFISRSCMNHLPKSHSFIVHFVPL